MLGKSLGLSLRLATKDQANPARAESDNFSGHRMYLDYGALMFSYSKK